MTFKLNNVHKAVNWNVEDDDFTQAFWDQNVKQFWLPEEISVSKDVKVWSELSPEERNLYKKVLGGLTLLDTKQANNGIPSMMSLTDNLQRKAVLSFMGTMEEIHAKSYSSIFTTLLLCVVTYTGYIKKNFPENIYITEQSNTTFNLSVPVTGSVYNSSVNRTGNELSADFNQEVTFISGEPANYNMDLKLFGLIFLKTVHVNVVNEQQVYPCGFQAGLYLKSNGILVVKTDSIDSVYYGAVNPCADILTKGDYILSVNNEKINSKKDFSDIIAYSEGNSLNLEIMRNGYISNVSVTPVLASDNMYKLGLWIKDDAQGIGTLTYIDQSYHFGALGHGITDNSTGKVMDISGGKIYNTHIISIVKGQDGTPGELQGIIDYKNSQPIGTISKNSDYGIYGTIDASVCQRHNLQLMNVGYRYMTHKGRAYIRFYRNNKYEDYDIEITSLGNSNSKNISFKVTSDKLIDMTNGIVQGMSGCPIIQDGRLIGAVTHVLIDDSKSGYGIYIENMLNASE